MGKQKCEEQQPAELLLRHQEWYKGEIYDYEEAG